MLVLKEITAYLESLAPLSTQESYDNAGLIVGDPEMKITKALISLDCTEAIVEDAISKGCELIIAHHPIVFKGLKSFTGRNYVERTVLKAIKNDIAIYAIHTNLDNYIHGVNEEIGDRMGLKNLRILDPKLQSLNKIVCYVPEGHLDGVRDAMFGAGGGEIGEYAECSFSTPGIGTYKPGENSNPFEGESGKRSRVEEVRLEVLVDGHLSLKVLQAMFGAHPYEEVAYEVYPLLNQNQYLGSGMVGELEEPLSETDFLTLLKERFNAKGIRYTRLLDKQVSKVAFCGGSGSFLLKKAIGSGADFFVTGDFKYHEFFDAEDKIVIADIGHFESEQFTSNRLSALLKKKFPKFAVHLTEVNTNPINYF